MADAGGEGRVVLEDDGRPVRLFRQAGVEPVQPLRTDLSRAGAGQDGVHGDQADRPVLHRVVEEPAAADPRRQIREGVGEAGALVVVAGNGEERDVERAQQAEQPLILLGMAGIHEVAGRQDHVGAGAERQDGGDGVLQERRGVDLPVSEAAGRLDVGVGDLDDDHGSAYRGLDV